MNLGLVITDEQHRDRFLHILFIFNHNWTLIDTAAFGRIGFGNRSAAAFRQGNNKAIAGNCDDAKFNFRDVFHG